jgi:hypothetical protein
MNHKRKRTKRQRAGCQMCKPWKKNGEPKLGHFTASEQCKLQEGSPEQIALDHEQDETREFLEYVDANTF